jgi:hypothetical protein
LEESVDINLIVTLGLYVFVVFVGCAFLLQRHRWRRRKRLGRQTLGFYPGATSLGNALHQLQTLAEPQVQHVIAEKLNEASEDDDEGGPVDPVAHLQRQARRMRRGEVVERLTALWRGK